MPQIPLETVAKIRNFNFIRFVWHLVYFYGWSAENAEKIKMAFVTTYIIGWQPAIKQRQLNYTICWNSLKLGSTAKALRSL